jgi:hypothetical protein
VENKEAVYWLSVLLAKLELRQEIIDALKKAINALLPDDDSDERKVVKVVIEEKLKGALERYFKSVGTYNPQTVEDLLVVITEVARNE